MKIRLLAFFAIFLLFAASISLVKKEVFDDTIHKTSDFTLIKNNFQEIIYTASLDTPQNVWYLSLSKEIPSSESICVEWQGSTGNTQTCIDHDASDDTGRYFTFPAFLPASQKVAFTIVAGQADISSEMLTLHSMNTQPVGTKYAFEPFRGVASPYVVSRAGWGADETLRYADNASQKANWQSELEYIQKEKTQSELDAITQSRARRNLVKESGGMATETQKLQYTENGHQLVWPIEKTRQKNQIIIHHTSQQIQGLSDEEMIRGIYRYHAVSRGWGDIGYNYIVGQNGKIYEGRAGGDYVVGAHALYNNKNSIGISVLGNYESISLNTNQKNGLQEMITYVAEKYGITLENRITGYKKCITKSCSILQQIYTYGLVGHGDVGYTTCPGGNIEVYIPFWRQMLNTARTPILNTLPEDIEPLPAERVMNMTLAGSKPDFVFPTKNTTENTQDTSADTTSSSTQINTQNTVSALSSVGVPLQIQANTTPQNTVSSAPTQTDYLAEKIAIKLSYPNETSITLEPYKNTTATALLDARRKPIYAGTKLQILLEGESRLKILIGEWEYSVGSFSMQGNQLQISSWIRIPAWDILARYNDNIFRDTIKIYNQNGKLLIVNELPLEYYLKGLGEVGNADNAEKIKTIIVAARSYARYYMSEKNRKYSTLLYDGSDDPDSFQQYLGYSYEMRAPRVASLVDATKGEIIFYDNIAIKPWYFNSSDGRTLSYLEYCQMNSGKNCSDIAYLQSVEDPAGVGKTRNGHGVGISGIGATAFAEQGWDYKKIISYYLSGASVAAQ